MALLIYFRPQHAGPLFSTANTIALTSMTMLRPGHVICIGFHITQMYGAVAAAISTAWNVHAALAIALHMTLLIGELTSTERKHIRERIADLLLASASKLIVLANMRPLQRSDLRRFYNQLANYMLGDGLELDPAQRLFVVRAIIRMAMLPYLPVFIADCIIGLVEFMEGAVLGKLMHCIDEPAQASPVDAYAYLAILALMRLIASQRTRVDYMRRAEINRISLQIEMAIFHMPLAQAALKHEHMFRYGRYHASKVVEGVINIYSQTSSLVTASIAFYMTKQTMG
ncbi:hypothetical protein EC988_005502, partial [Linderina pennispora]